MSRIAVLIPCYNEQQTIARVVSDFQKALPEATVYVYDNNSTDDSVKCALAAGAVVRHEPRQGKGNVLRAMLRDIDADCYLLTDGDDTYDASHAAQMCGEVLHNHADMVIGDRLSSTYYQENTRLFHGAGNRIVKHLVNTIFKSGVSDIMTGYRALSPLFAKTFPILSEGFELETEMTIHALDKRLRIAELPVLYRGRPEGSVSKLGTFSDGARVLLTILKLYKEYKPLPFFFMLAAVLAVLSAGFFIPVLTAYLKTGLVLQFPTLIVSGFVMVAALMCLSCGLILDTIAQKARQEFEFRLNMARMMINMRQRNEDTK